MYAVRSNVLLFEIQELYRKTALHCIYKYHFHLVCIVINGWYYHATRSYTCTIPTKFKFWWNRYILPKCIFYLFSYLFMQNQKRWILLIFCPIVPRYRWRLIHFSIWLSFLHKLWYINARKITKGSKTKEDNEYIGIELLYSVHWIHMWPLLLTWFNFNPSMNM